MKNVMKSVTLGLVLAASAFAAHAVNPPAPVYDIKREFNIDLSSKNTAAFSDVFEGFTGKTFKDTFSFSISTKSDLDAALTSIATLRKSDLDITGFSLFKGSDLVAAGTQESGGKADFWTLSYTNLLQGAYSLAVTGKVLGTTGGSFGGNVNVSPVPEPATWGMMLGGLGLMGWIARRRKSSASTPTGFAAA